MRFLSHDGFEREIVEEVVKEGGAINDSLISEGLTGKEDTAQVRVFKDEIGLVFLP